MPAAERAAGGHVALSDAGWREAERLWRAEPTSEEAFARAVAECRRAARELPFDMLCRLPRWRPLVAFLAGWFGRPPVPSDGIEPDTLPHGPTLPLALREWLRLVARRGDVASAFHRPLLVEPFEEEEGRLPIYCENQGVVEWAINTSDLRSDDPPVWSAWSKRHGYTEWRRQHDTTSEFLLCMAMSHRVLQGSPIGAPHGVARGVGLERALELEYERLPVANWEWPAGPGELSWFGGDGATLFLYY